MSEGQGKYHTVRSGEWISKIAAQNGISDWRTVWNAPENTDLRDARPDPNLIHPGDVVYVPPVRRKHQAGDADARHKFKLKKNLKRLKIKLEDATGRPRAGIPCVLLIDNQEHHGVRETDGEGIIDALISDNAQGGFLLVGDDRRERYEIRLGHLDPIDTVRGYQQRLNNLGHYKGSIDGIEGPLTRAAVRAFQERENLLGYKPALGVDGIMGPKTREALLKRHKY
jgi:N-acetylmuramoyl-L-alanine amidase